jgi:hypothetical protein
VGGRLPYLGFGVAGLAGFLVALLFLVPGQEFSLNNVGGGAGTTSTETTGAETTGAEATTPQARIEPKTVVIRGSKGGIGEVTWWFPPSYREWRPNKVEYDKAPLAVWDGKKSGWSNVSGPGGSANMDVSRVYEPDNGDTGWGVPCLSAGPTKGVANLPDETGKPRCYRIQVDDGPNAVPAGEYAAAIYVEDADDNPTAVPVEVLVSRPLGWLIGAVIAGVLITEFVVWRRGPAGQRSRWRVLRGRWLDWLSEDLDWTRPYNGDAKVEGYALLAARDSLRRCSK